MFKFSLDAGPRRLVNNFAVSPTRQALRDPTELRGNRLAHSNSLPDVGLCFYQVNWRTAWMIVPKPPLPSTAIVLGYTLAVANPTVSIAATKEEVAHCRAIEQRAERLDCFKSLKQGPESKTRAPATEDAAPTKAGKTENGNGFSTSNDPAITSSIERFSLPPGLPVCVDTDALAAMLTASLLTSDATKIDTVGCRVPPADTKLEVLERRPSVFPSLRVVKVKVTSPTLPNLTSGYTIETTR